MKKIILTLLVLFTITTVIQSQCKDIVFVEYFSSKKEIERSYAKDFRNKVIAGITNTDRVLLKDVESEKSLKKEEQRQTEDAASIDEERLVEMKNLNAKYLIQGHLSNLSTESTTNKEGEVFYNGNSAYTLKIIDVATGTVKGTESYSHGSFSNKTPEKAMESALNYVDGDMKKLVNKHFPVEGTILEINAEKKNEAKEVYINLGSLCGIKKGQQFEVFVTREIAGRESQKKIGELKVAVVEGKDLSLCKVSKGGKEIKTAIGEGQEITIKSYYSAGFFGL
ncbi:MAG: penicillin-binding protein activator LpoB [Dysgonamonadaceae bacterium]|jgi:hypothetical protein|nr:penicillin-binding protein activator LpoB [Dysgonamonadaceae bacterium]